MTEKKVKKLLKIAIIALVLILLAFAVKGALTTPTGGDDPSIFVRTFLWLVLIVSTVIFLCLYFAIRALMAFASIPFDFIVAGIITYFYCQKADKNRKISPNTGKVRLGVQVFFVCLIVFLSCNILIRHQVMPALDHIRAKLD